MLADRYALPQLRDCEYGSLSDTNHSCLPLLSKERDELSSRTSPYARTNA